VQPIGGGLSLGRGGEQGAFVMAKNLQPVREVGGVIGRGSLAIPKSAHTNAAPIIAVAVSWMRASEAARVCL
jgi:hypothetical protein